MTTRPAVALVALLTLALGSGAFSQTVPAEKTPGPFFQVVTAAIANHQLPGAVVLVGRGDAVVYSQAFGNRAFDPALEPMTDDTIFDIASLTKVVATTTSIMKLIEEGKIRLNDPVVQFIPEFSHHGKSAIT